MLALIALGTLAYGVYVPALEFESLFGDETFSVLTGIQGFVESGNLLLAMLLFSFSVLFPAVKLVTILVVWFGSFDPDRRREVVEWLELLGKWSLLDSFVIVTLIGTVQLGILSEAVAHYGVYVYLAAILLSLLATFLLRPLAARTGSAKTGRFSVHGLWITLPSAVLYGIGLSAPLMYVEKGWFWDNSYSLLEGITHLQREDETLLAVALTVFVVVVPTIRFIGLVLLRLLQPRDSRLVSGLRIVDKLSMMDVFVLALIVVLAKIGDLADATPRVGLWFLIGSALLTGVDSVLLHRSGRSA